MTPPKKPTGKPPASTPSEAELKVLYRLFLAGKASRADRRKVVRCLLREANPQRVPIR